MSYRKGFSIVEAIVIVVVLALIGLVGVKAWDAFHKTPVASTTSSTTASDSTPTTAPAINSSADLDKTTKLLDSVDIDGQESTELNQQTNF